MYVAVVFYIGNKGAKAPAIGTYHYAVTADTIEEAGQKALTWISVQRAAYPNNEYEILVGELDSRIEPVRPEVRVVPIKAMAKANALDNQVL
jgi:hypothetical protein